MVREKTPRYKALEWLRNHGCAYDSVEQPAAEPDPVDIWIDRTPLLSLLFRIAPGLPAFYLWAQFSPRQAAVHVAEVWFELRDAPDIRFQLLPCPGPKHEPYRFPGGAFELPQEQVLNAFFPGTLYRHHPIEGYIMGVAYQSLPVGVAGMVGAELSVTDEFGKVVGSAQFDISLDPNEHGKRCTGRKGKGLFEPLDDNEEPIIPEVPLERKPFNIPRTVPYVHRTETVRGPSDDGNGEMQPEREK